MDCVRIGVGSFLIQAESVREEIKTNFLRSRQILAVKESDLLSELDQLVASYKGVRTIGLIEELNQKKEFLENFEHNEIQATIVKSVAVMDAEIRQLKTSLETTVARMKSVKLMWDGGLEKKLDQIGWIWVEYEENIQRPTSSLGNWYFSSSDEEPDSKEESREKGQNISYFFQSGKDFSMIESSTTLKASDKLNISQQTLTVPSKNEQLKTVKLKLKEMTKQFDQYKMKYNDSLLTRLKHIEEELNDLKRSNHISPLSHQFKLDSGGESIDSSQSDMSIEEVIDPFPVDKTSQRPKSGIRRNKLEYLPAPDNLKIPQIANFPSEIKGDRLECYSPNILKQYINSASTLIYKKNSIKTINLSFLKNPDGHKDNQVFVKVKEIYRLGYLKVIFSKKLPYFNKTEIIAGIRLEEPYGNSSGIHDSVKHFNCPAKHAIFISINEVFVPIF